MHKGKHPFAESSDSEAGNAGFEAPPGEADFRIEPGPVRRQLTPRDVARNAGAATLFNRVIPGLPIDADPPETRQEAEPFSALIERTLKRLNIAESPWLDELAQAWPRLVPSEVAQVSRPGKWADGILYIYVTSSPKLFELRRSSMKRIEQAVRAFAGDDRVKHVRLMVNAVTLPFEKKEVPPRSPARGT